MWHRVKKIKFRAGKDANKMLMRKLVTNFFAKGKLTTTIKKAKVLKSLVEKLVQKTKEKTEANKNYLLRYLTDKKLLTLLFENIGPALKTINGGYVRVIRLGVRNSDGSEVGRLEWAYPIVIEEPKIMDKEQLKKGIKKEVKSPSSHKPARPAGGSSEGKQVAEK